MEPAENESLRPADEPENDRISELMATNFAPASAAPVWEEIAVSPESKRIAAPRSEAYRPHVLYESGCHRATMRPDKLKKNHIIAHKPMNGLDNLVALIIIVLVLYLLILVALTILGLHFLPTLPVLGIILLSLAVIMFIYIVIGIVSIFML